MAWSLPIYFFAHSALDRTGLHTKNIDDKLDDTKPHQEGVLFVFLQQLISRELLQVIEIIGLYSRY